MLKSLMIVFCFFFRLNKNTTFFPGNTLALAPILTINLLIRMHVTRILAVSTYKPHFNALFCIIFYIP